MEEKKLHSIVAESTYKVDLIISVSLSCEKIGREGLLF